MGRRVALLAAAIAGVLAVTGCATGPTPPADRLSPLPADAELLFVARSAMGTLTMDAQTGTLTAEAVTAVSWFTDRPQRSAGMTSLTEALDALGWDTATGVFDVAPNAELTADELGATSVPLELTGASIEGDQVTFTVTALDDASLASTSLSDLELFIDGGDVYVTTMEFPGNPGCTADFSQLCVKLPSNVCGVTVTVQDGEVGVQVLHLGETVQTVNLGLLQPTASVSTAPVNGTIALDSDAGTLAFDFMCDSDLGAFAVHVADWQVLPSAP